MGYLACASNSLSTATGHVRFRVRARRSDTQHSLSTRGGDRRTDPIGDGVHSMPLSA